MSALHFVLVASLSVQTPSVSPLNVDTTTVRHRITTTNPVAQQYFDKGLGLVFAARHSEAVESFRTAQRIDPTCAMCYWGEALALGPSVGRAMSASDDSAAQAAISKAERRAGILGLEIAIPRGTLGVEAPPGNPNEGREAAGPNRRRPESCVALITNGKGTAGPGNRTNSRELLTALGVA